jgi:hypothetical protein
MSYYLYVHEGIYMICGAQIRDSWFIEVGWRFPQCSHRFQSLLCGAEVDNTREGS